jgi:Rrf2 family protein
LSWRHRGASSGGFGWEAAMKLSRTVTYAIHAMLRLAEADQGVPVPCSQLAREGHMPERFLLQVLRVLVTHNLLKSTRGVDGGYYLALRPDQITIGDIVEAFDLEAPKKAAEVRSPTRAQQEQVEAVLKRASQAARAELRKLTLADLIQRAERGSLVSGGAKPRG